MRDSITISTGELERRVHGTRIFRSFIFPNFRKNGSLTLSKRELFILRFSRTIFPLQI
jgi:hypothetical protein